MSREEELYTGFCERWRNIPKITIAAVQGKCVSGGLLLCWPCDLIVASDDAEFQEVTVAMGVTSVLSGLLILGRWALAKQKKCSLQVSQSKRTTHLHSAW